MPWANVEASSGARLGQGKKAFRADSDTSHRESHECDFLHPCEPSLSPFCCPTDLPLASPHRGNKLDFIGIHRTRSPGPLCPDRRLLQEMHPHVLDGWHLCPEWNRENCLVWGRAMASQSVKPTQRGTSYVPTAQTQAGEHWKRPQKGLSVPQFPPCSGHTP